MNMDEYNQQRYYASKQYLLPNDKPETSRAFENRLSLAPLELQTGDRVLESGAGTGIWALEFSEQHKDEGIELDIECTDISDKQFPQSHPSNIRFSLHSVLDLPEEWSGTFLYAHQRLLVAAMNDARWRKAISELFRVLLPGGWVELVETEAKDFRFAVGPYSEKLTSLIKSMYAEKGVIGNLGAYLPPLMEEAGFVNVRCEARHLPIGESVENGYLSEEWRDLWKGMKQPFLEGGGYGYVETEEEIDEMLERSTLEWNNLNEASCTFYTILARKP
ncbi:hypothetical protein GYMLUDRAFT_239209 [Collybiopsis luxurians FD-317 M1]|nr:hypothetical protein GYMLUDRAFT_239209 [Collybiopsis luxurians FD-317 M1]